MKGLKAFLLGLSLATGLLCVSVIIQSQSNGIEAAAGFDNETNGVLLPMAFHEAKDVFDERKAIVNHLGPSAQGAGYVESIDDSVLIAIANRQATMSRGKIAGQIVTVPVLEAHGALRVGRFGWQNQHASLESFAAETYLNAAGTETAAQQLVSDSEDDGDDIEVLASFMRSTKVPPRNEQLAATSEAQSGEDIFGKIGCAFCHVPTITTAAPGTVINGGAFIVPPALGSKVIHPFGDFLLHDIGIGKVRTAPLWGLRTHKSLMHDGASLTIEGAILRHGGEAQDVTNRFRSLRRFEQHQLLQFLLSL